MKTNDTTFYRTAFKNWPKQAGSKPTNEMLEQIHALGLRPGKQALANAMYLRPEGATSPQVVLVIGAPQLNRMRDLKKRGYVKGVAAPITDAGHMVYRIELTAKGKAKVGKAQPKQEKPVEEAAPVTEATQ